MLEYAVKFFAANEHNQTRSQLAFDTGVTFKTHPALPRRGLVTTTQFSVARPGKVHPIGLFRGTRAATRHTRPYTLQIFSAAASEVMGSRSGTNSWATQPVKPVPAMAWQTRG